MTREAPQNAEMATPLYLNVQQAAETLQLGVSTLNKLRVRGGGPRFAKLGRRVVYRRADLVAWAEDRLVSSTSEVVVVERGSK